MAKKSFIIYQNWAEIIKRLPTEDAGELIKAVCCYETGEKYETDNPYVDAIFEGQIKPQLDKDAEKYAKEVEKRSDAGKKGMKSRWGNNTPITNDNTVITNDNNVISPITNDNTTITKITDTDTVTETDTDNVSPTEIKKETPTESRKKFSPPSAEEVAAYCRERQNKVNADTFVDFYTAKGWKVGNTPMKDWKAAVRTWEKRDGGRASPEKPKTKFTNYEEREIDFDSLEARFARN